MMNYWQLLELILPVFAIVAIGVALRRARWLTAEADESLLKLTVNFLYPCLIFESVAANPALRDPRNLLWAPLVGFFTIVLGLAVAFYAGRALGLVRGTGLRTFTFAVGFYNYSYIPIALMPGLFGHDSLGVLLVHNVGCEAAVWTVGVLVLAGVPLREGWRRLASPPVLSLILALVVNLCSLNSHIPAAAMNVVHLCGASAIPLGLLFIGATMENYILEKPWELFETRTTFGACLLRQGLLPIAFLLLAKFLPCTPELKRVIVVQAAMPSGILSIVLAKHYGGRPLTAVQIVVSTTALGVLVIPLWLQLGLAWVGG
ncbi:MAG: AEC family transporter [Opitutaceae bacterium]|jgi:predicted permease